MSKKKNLPPKFKYLRQRAEEEIKAEHIVPEAMSQEECALLIHELQVHQIELEMQNEELRRAQNLLAESRDKYADLYDFAPTGYLSLDERGRIVEANLTAATMLGRERSRLLGRIFTNFLVKAERMPFFRLMAGILQPQQQQQVHLKSGEGEVRALLLDIHFDWRGEGPKIIRVAMTDITELTRVQEELRLHQEDLEELVTERTAANERLRQANEELEALFEAAPLAIGVFDAQGRFVTANPATERVFGWPLEEVKGKAILSFPNYDPTEVAELLQRALRGESMAEVELKQPRRDGSLIDIRLWTAPLLNPEGKLRGFMGLAEDITERKRAAEALAESEERYRSLFQNNHAVMLLIDPETAAVVDANPASSKYYGYNREELTSKKMSEINTRPMKQIKKEMRLACSGEEQKFFFQHRLADGAIRDVEVFTGPIMIRGRKLLYSIVHDITTRRQAEEELYRSYQRLDLLAGTAEDLLASAAPPQVIDNLCFRLLDFLQCEVYLNYLTDIEDKFLNLHTYSGIDAEAAERFRWLSFGQGVCGYTAQERRRVVAENIQESDDPMVEVLKTFGLKTYACHPLLASGRVLGTLGFGSRTRTRFAQDELGLMNAVADQVAMALDRQQAQQALAESESRYRQLVEMSPDGILVHQKGRYVFINRAGAALFGADDPQALVGRRVLETVHPDFVKRVKKRVQQVQAGKRTEVQEIKILRLDGKAVDVEASAVPVSYRGEAAVQVMLRDISRRKEAEEALRQERDFSAALLDTLGALVVVLDREGRIVRFNHACEMNTGYLFAEVEGKHFFDIFLLPEEKPSVLKTFQKLRQGELPSTYENYWLNRSREKILISWSNNTLTDANGKVTFIIGTGIDITRQRQAEEALRQAHDELEQRVAARTEQLRQTVDKLLKEIKERERAEINLRKSEARFAAFMKNLPGSAIMRDRAGKFLFANETWELTVGRQPGETIGKTLNDLWPPEIAAKLQELDRQVFAEKRPLEAMFELPVQGEKRTYLSYRFPIRNEVGEVEMLGAIGIDVTARLKAEEARDRLIEILEATPDFVGSADREGRIFYLNRAAREMLGLQANEDFTFLSYDQTMPGWALERLLSQGKPEYLAEGFWQGESAIRRRDGSEIPVSQVILAHRDPENRIKFFSTICRDITEMKRAAAALRKSKEKLRQLTMQLLSAQEDERQRLAAELHDELGHALLILKLHLSEVEQKLRPDQEELQGKMTKIAAYLTDTVGEVRRLYYALSPGDLEDLGLTTALRNLVEDFQELYGNIHWDVKIANLDNLFPLPIQTMIYRIVQEALTNIGKHAYPEHVKIKFNQKDQRAVFRIEDDGRGFSMDDELEAGKRGMGLAAMAQRVNLAGGEFDIWSREKQGVKVIFTIPFSSSGEKI